MFCCNHIEKEVCVDHYETGCEMDRTCILSDKCDFRAETVAGLLEKIGAHYGLEIEDVWTGKRKLWLADWSFRVEKIVVSDVEMADLVGVKHHE